MEAPFVTLRLRASTRLDSVRYSPDGRFVAAIQTHHDAPYELVCWEVSTGRAVLRRPTRGHFQALAWAGASTLVCWERLTGRQAAVDPPLVALFVDVASGAVTRRFELPEDTSDKDFPLLAGARSARRALIALGKRARRGPEKDARPGHGWIVDADTGAVCAEIALDDALAGEDHTGFLSLWSLSPDGARALIGSYVGGAAPSFCMHVFDGTALQFAREIERYGALRWLDDETAVLHPTGGRDGPLVVVGAQQQQPLLFARLEHEHVVGLDPVERAIITVRRTEGVMEFVSRGLSGEERTLGALRAREWATPGYAMWAARVDGALRVLQVSAEKLTTAQRTKLAAAEPDSDPRVGVVLSDAITGESVMIHAVDKINLRDLHNLYNPVEVILDPSDNSLGILVRRALGKGRRPLENDDLLSVDVRAAVRAFEPPRAPKTKTKKPAR